MGQSIGRAIEDMPDDFQIKEILVKNRAEVESMCLTEYDEKRTMELFKEDGKSEERANTEAERKRADAAEQRAELAKQQAEKAEKTGEEKHLIKQICNKLRRGMSPEAIADDLEEDRARISTICRVAEDFSPDYDALKIWEKMCEQVTA